MGFDNTNKQLDPRGRVDGFGDPLTMAEGRLTDLRDSGYRGPVDQNGNRVSDAETDATGTAR